MKKRNENDKNTNFMMKNNKNVLRKYMKALSNIFIMNLPHLPRCNMLQTLERRKNILVSFCQASTLNTLIFWLNHGRSMS